MRAVAVGAVLGVMLLGCDRPAPRTPEAAYRHFAEALRKGEVKTAYQALSAASQHAIEARSKAISDASREGDAGVIRDDPATMLFATGIRPKDLGDVKVLRSDEHTATLEVRWGDDAEQVKLVKDGEQWKVDLTEAFPQ